MDVSEERMLGEEDGRPLPENGPKVIKEEDSCVRMRINKHSRHRTKNVTSEHLVANLMILYLKYILYHILKPGSYFR